MAGHSKWANIQHRKGRQDAVRSKLFSKLSKEITVAAKMGDTDPEKNPRLRLAVREAKNNSVPKDVIERAIRKSSAADSHDYYEIRYEGYGVAGVAIIVETLTDNRNRTASNVRSIFNKYGGNLSETGSVSFMFNRVGIISYPEDIANADEILEAAIEAGADDMESLDHFHNIFCSDRNLSDVANELESRFGDCISSKLIWRPQNLIEVALEQAEKLLKLIEALEEDDDVQNVTSNFCVSDEVSKIV